MVKELHDRACHLLLAKEIRKESEAASVEGRGENKRKHSTLIGKRKNSLVEELEEDKISVTEDIISF